MVYFNRAIHYIPCICAAVLSVILPLPALAVQVYQIDLLIFEQTLDDPSGKLTSHESWPKYVLPPYPSNAKPLFETLESNHPESKKMPDGGTETASDNVPIQSAQINPGLTTLSDNQPTKIKWYTALPSNQDLLSAYEKRLSKSNHYHILWHKSWQQPLSFLSHPVIIEMTDHTNGWQPTQLTGTVTIRDRRFHQASLNLLLSHPDLKENFHLAENRNFKGDAVQYFDHPKFGALLMVSPIELSPDTKTQ